MPAFTYVDHPDRICPQLESPDLVGVDTEFMRERTFFSQLCLVQVASGDDIFCVDPLSGQSMENFWATLNERTWVLHSSRQDIEVIFHTAGFMPRRIFDTQVAAGLLGYQPQMGYGGLVHELFDVELPKSHTRANWTKRPLQNELLEYAAEDVEYLVPAYERLAERLDAKGRLGWAEADSALLLDEQLYDTDPSRAITRLKGARNLKGRKRAVASRLAAWREQEALDRDRPRQWILRDNILLDIVGRMPTNLAELGEVRELPGKVIGRSGKKILAAIANGQNNGAGHDYRPPGPPDEEQKALLKQMLHAVAECAKDLDIPAETIASKKELSAVIIGGSRESRVFGGWRLELIGDQLAKLL